MIAIPAVVHHPELIIKSTPQVETSTIHSTVQVRGHGDLPRTDGRQQEHPVVEDDADHFLREQLQLLRVSEGIGIFSGCASQRMRWPIYS